MPPQINTTQPQDEILVKGSDGKFYILRNGELTPKEEASVPAVKASLSTVQKKSPTTGRENIEARKQIIFDSYKKEVRDEAETRQALTRSSAMGGLGVTDEQARQMVADVKKSESIVPAIQPTASMREDRWKHTARMALQAYGRNIAGDKEKLLSLLATFLRDIRDVFELKDLLRRDVAHGGFGMLDADIDSLLYFVKEAKAILQNGGTKEKVLTETKTEAVVLPSTTKAEVSLKQIVPTTPLPTALIPKREELPKIRPVKEVVKPVTHTTPRPTETKKPTLRRLPSATPSSKRPHMADITYTPRLTGPLEELAELRLSDFRYLAKNATQAADRILQKIEVLGEESFAKRVEGIKAWHRSPLYAVYLDIGRKSLELGKSVEEVLLMTKEKMGDQALSVDEFRGIMELNGKLRG